MPQTAPPAAPTLERASLAPRLPGDHAFFPERCVGFGWDGRWRESAGAAHPLRALLGRSTMRDH
eukprot:6185198-Prymnesium_polylepis.1